MTEVRVPTLGESVTEATVATWFKKAGDTVAQDEMICELETDKVTVEVPSPFAGVLTEIVAAEGETVGVNALLANISEGNEASPTAAASPTTSAGSETITIMVPALGESVAEATVGSWFKKVGDSVSADEMLCELETDKVSVEVPSPGKGILTEILAADGQTVAAGGQLGVISGSASAAAITAPAAQGSSTPAASAKGVKNSPSAEKLMSEQGIDASQVKGSGKDGRIMKEDVQTAMAAPAAPTATVSSPPTAPAATIPAASPISATPVASAQGEREERIKMTRLRQTIARRLKESQNTAAMLTTYNEVDMSAVMKLRTDYKEMFLKKHGVKMGFMSFFTKACCHALKEVPEVNAEIDGTDVVYKNYVNMGIAVGTPNGLVVPVVRDADQMGFSTIEKTINELGLRARDGKLGMAEMQGGTFTISNGGVYGSLMSSPILNPPQSGILGMHTIQKRPVVVNDEIVIRPMMYLALSYDHRIVDGKGAVTFLVRVKEALEDPRRLLMDL